MRLTLLVLTVTQLLACGQQANEPQSRQQSDNVTPSTSSALSSTEEVQIAHELIVYKDPQCGCCGAWAEHMTAAGFKVNTVNSKNMQSIKSQYRVAPNFQSCHTVVDSQTGYVFEGHIPASTITRFLEEKPVDALGLAVPGMPVGSPGMEMGDRFDDYDVLLLKKDGSSEVYEEVRSKG